MLSGIGTLAKIRSQWPSARVQNGCKPIARAFRELGVPHNADFIYLWAPAFMSDLTLGLADRGVAASRIHTEVFGAGPTITPGVTEAPRRHRTCRPGVSAPVRWCRSLGAGSMFAGGSRSRACSSLPKHATYRCDGRAVRGFAIRVRRDLWLGLSATGLSRLMHRRTAMCWSAAASLRAMSSVICDES